MVMMSRAARLRREMAAKAVRTGVEPNRTTMVGGHFHRLLVHPHPPSREVEGQVACLERVWGLDHDAGPVGAVDGLDDGGSRRQDGLIEAGDRPTAGVLLLQRRALGPVPDPDREVGPLRVHAHQFRAMFVGEDVADGRVGIIRAVAAGRVGGGEGSQDEQTDGCVIRNA
jgi:hypothetical protein